MKKKATNVLLEMGVGIHTKGFKYIVDIMCLFEEEEQWKNGKLMAVYYKIASMNNEKHSNVERCIRHSFKTALENGNPEVVDKYLVRTNIKNNNLLHVFYHRLTEYE